VDNKGFQSHWNETRRFEASADFKSRARLSSMTAYQALYQNSIDDPQAFWEKLAADFDWYKPWDTVLSGDAPNFTWFAGGKTNLSANALDRHVREGRRNQAALIFEGEPGDVQTYTYGQLLAAVERAAAALENLGLRCGERVAIYMPLIPEAIIAMLACARLGAIHSVVFGGFQASALRDRIQDAQASFVITADGGWRRGKPLPLKDIVDEALAQCPSVRRVLVVNRCNLPTTRLVGRDFSWTEALAMAPTHRAPEPLDSEHPSFILYTSGTTGKPKGIVHTTAGYMLGTWLSCRDVFDLRDGDTFWCTADVGWITGHSYLAYGPLLNGTTIFIYEGAPMTPHPGRFWELIERHHISILYTAPTAIRAFMKMGEGWPARYDLSSLRLLGSVGEPINPEAWVWYFETIGRSRCPIVDTWWQTETGSIMVSPLPGATTLKPGSATRPLYGVIPRIVDEAGKPLPNGQGGYLTIEKPWPSMARTIWNDHQRFVETYWTRFPGAYFTGDGARFDSDGDLWIMGRVDDVINTSGHRLGSAEIESALVSDLAVAEAAVVGFPHELKGEGIAAFVTLKGGRVPKPDEADRLKALVAHLISPIARPDQLRFTDALPKTRSGKIMRRLLRDIAAGRSHQGDTSTLEDFSVLASLRASEET
jgi:acetyl-CoA synthetase